MAARHCGHCSSAEFAMGRTAPHPAHRETIRWASIPPPRGPSAVGGRGVRASRGSRGSRAPLPALLYVLFVAASIASVTGGPLADRAGRFAVLLTGMALLSVPGLIAFTDAYAMVLVLFGLAGVGYGFTSIGLYALLSDLLPARRGL